MGLFFRKEEDWKDFLSEDAQKVLAELLEETKKHRAAYSASDDVKIAQLWAALIELKKDVREVRELLGKLEEPFRAIVSVGEEEKRKTIEKLIAEIVKPSDKETEEATKKLVESLMKF